MPHRSCEEMVETSRDFYSRIRTRRTVRDFACDDIPLEVIRNCLLAAGSAPNGANLQPWHFVVVSNPETKHQIRIAAEKEEEAFYSGRAPKEWLDAVEPLGTDANKPFIENAPYLIAIFAEKQRLQPDGSLAKTITSQNPSVLLRAY